MGMRFHITVDADCMLNGFVWTKIKKRRLSQLADSNCNVYTYWVFSESKLVYILGLLHCIYCIYNSNDHKEHELNYHAERRILPALFQRHKYKGTNSAWSTWLSTVILLWEEWKSCSTINLIIINHRRLSDLVNLITFESISATLNSRWFVRVDCEALSVT